MLATELKTPRKERDSTGSRELLLRIVKERMIKVRQCYLRDAVAELTDRASIWRLVDTEGVTSEKSTMATNFFLLDELNTFYSIELVPILLDLVIVYSL